MGSPLAVLMDEEAGYTRLIGVLLPRRSGLTPLQRRSPPRPSPTSRPGHRLSPLESPAGPRRLPPHRAAEIRPPPSAMAPILREIARGVSTARMARELVRAGEAPAAAPPATGGCRGRARPGPRADALVEADERYVDEG
jgi:hypothetical protein